MSESQSWVYDTVTQCQCVIESNELSKVKIYDFDNFWVQEKLAIFGN